MAQKEKVRRRKKRTLTAIDLFAGCGGLSVGLRRADFHILAAIEIDALAAETYRANHRTTTVIHEDIRNVDPKALMRKLRLRRGQLDLLAGCPPCQGFSTVRTLNGGRRVREPLNSLLFEFLRFIRAMKPKFIMVENVPALAHNWRIRKFRQELRRLGYEWTSDVLDVADFGVPQRRRRFIGLAALAKKPRLAPPSLRRRTVRQAIGNLKPPGRTGDPLHDFPEKRSQRIQNLIRRIPKNGGTRSAAGLKGLLACHRRVDGFHDVYGRMAWDDVAPTITGGCINPSKGRFLHPDQDRAITLREAALLQTFPKNYKFSLDRGKYAAAQMIGNALPPRFIEQQARQIASMILR